MALLSALMLLLGAASICVAQDFPSFDPTKGRMCSGTNFGLNEPANRRQHYYDMRARYTNCTHVIGNLEISWLDRVDLGFLEHIEEVSGYVLIAYVRSEILNLPRLETIYGGQSLFNKKVYTNDFTLVIMYSELHYLLLPKLKRIVLGSVLAYKNRNLCHIDKLPWEEIFLTPNEEFLLKFHEDYPEPKCTKCVTPCGDNHRGYKCSLRCGDRDCFGKRYFECCHEKCAGGCFGSTNNKCYACKHVDDDGVCKLKCPSHKITYNSMCLKKCPENTFKYDGTCVKLCPKDTLAENGECVKCSGKCESTSTCPENEYYYHGICVYDCPFEWLGKDGYCYKNGTKLACPENKFMFGGSCVDECPEDTMPNGEECVPCDGACGESSEKCPNNFSYFYGHCVQECPKNTESVNGRCVPCDDQCKAQFRKCPMNQYNYKGICLWKCPADTTDDKDGDCVECDGPCEEKYLKCPENEYYYDGICYDECPEETRPEKGKCVDCNGPCETVLKCPKNEFYYQGICYNICPVETKPVNDKCVECDGPCEDSTVKCPGDYKLYHNMCVEKCPKRTQEKDGVCVPCNGTCEVKCLHNEYYYRGYCLKKCPNKTQRIGNECVDCDGPCEQPTKDCPKGEYYYSGYCVDECPNETKLKNGICVDCDGPCDETPTKCPGKSLYYYGQCVQRCLGNTEPKDGVCVPCNGPCLIRPSSDCYENEHIWKGVCVEKCPENTKLANGECIDCNGPCEEAPRKCPNGYFAYHHVCVEMCPPDTIRKGFTCIDIEVTIIVTTKCPKNTFKSNGKCVTVCPINTQVVSGECVACNGPCEPCPANFYKYGRVCVSPCPNDTIAKGDTCEPCGDLCEITCKGTEFVHLGNIESFRRCTKLEGNLIITNETFNGDEQHRIHPRHLEVFSTLREVTGNVSIQGEHPDFTSLYFLRNLRKIRGYGQLGVTTLYIAHTSLRSLEWRALKFIASGTIWILDNVDLCFVDGLDWKKLVQYETQETIIKNNRKSIECKRDDQVCSEECTMSGCWGTGPDQCVECKHMQYNGTCVANCTSSQYANNDECFDCHPSCVGCTGPEQIIGKNGCKSCQKGINRRGELQCLKEDEACPDGFFNQILPQHERGLFASLAGNAVCRKCHKLCQRCSSYGASTQECFECTDFEHNDRCVSECPMEMYGNKLRKKCYSCHQTCFNGCHGPTANECKDSFVSHRNKTEEHTQHETHVEIHEQHQTTVHTHNVFQTGLFNCSEECDKAGCFGPGPGQCYGCAHVQFSGICLRSCKRWPNLYLLADMKNCKECHPKCEASCEGPEEIDCLPVNSTVLDIDNPMTIHEAARDGYDEIVRILIKSGANVDITDIDIRTPLHLAAMHGYEKIVQMLINNGAAVNIIDKDNKTAMHYAAKKIHNFDLIQN